MTVQDLVDEREELKATYRRMMREIKSPFDEAVQDAIGIMMRQYIRLSEKEISEAPFQAQ